MIKLVRKDHMGLTTNIMEAVHRLQVFQITPLHLIIIPVKVVITIMVDSDMKEKEVTIKMDLIKEIRNMKIKNNHLIIVVQIGVRQIHGTTMLLTAIGVLEIGELSFCFYYSFDLNLY